MSAAEALGLPPGVRFDPTGDELVEHYLLRRALGRPPAVPGIIIEDDAAAATTTGAEHSWTLLTRHRRTDDNEAFFFERVAGETKGGAGARRDRSCGDGRWTWVGQKRAPDEELALGGDGEHVSWGKYSLNLHKGRSKGGSTGWVMHEYTVAASTQCPLLPVKLCHVSFTGHGQKRQRIPDDAEGERQELEPQASTQPPHKRAATGSCMVTTATAMPYQELNKACAQNQAQQQFANCHYDTSSIGHFWSSDAGFCQEPSIILDPWYPDAQSNPQEPQAWHPLIEEQQFSVAQLLGGISSPPCPPTTPDAYHEKQHIQGFAVADLPLSTDHESCTDSFFEGWGDLNSFCDTSGIQDDDGMAAQTLAVGA